MGYDYTLPFSVRTKETFCRAIIINHSTAMTMAISCTPHLAFSSCERMHALLTLAASTSRQGIIALIINCSFLLHPSRCSRYNRYIKHCCCPVRKTSLVNAGMMRLCSHGAPPCMCDCSNITVLYSSPHKWMVAILSLLGSTLRPICCHRVVSPTCPVRAGLSALGATLALL